jgi:hypothetical protein
VPTAGGGARRSRAGIGLHPGEQVDVHLAGVEDIDVVPGEPGEQPPMSCA